MNTHLFTHLGTDSDLLILSPSWVLVPPLIPFPGPNQNIRASFSSPELGSPGLPLAIREGPRRLGGPKSRHENMVIIMYSRTDGSVFIFLFYSFLNPISKTRYILSNVTSFHPIYLLFPLQVFSICKKRRLVKGDMQEAYVQFSLSLTMLLSQTSRDNSTPLFNCR